MDRKTALMVGAAATALWAGSALAQAPAVPIAATYAELLEPIPNAVERLALSDAEAAERSARLIPVQMDHHHHHHHHHHDDSWYQQNGYYRNGGVWVLRSAHHHHHHHHSHSWYRRHGYQWNGGAWVLRPPHHHHHHHHHHNNS
jgi:Tfp pilus assembly protein FimV